jgi:hypothetical protein
MLPFRSNSHKTFVQIHQPKVENCGCFWNIAINHSSIRKKSSIESLNREFRTPASEFLICLISESFLWSEKLWKFRCIFRETKLFNTTDEVLWNFCLWSWSHSLPMLRQTPRKVREKQEIELGQENRKVLSYFEINCSCSSLGEPATDRWSDSWYGGREMKWLEEVALWEKLNETGTVLKSNKFTEYKAEKEIEMIGAVLKSRKLKEKASESRNGMAWQNGRWGLVTTVITKLSKVRWTLKSRWSVWS